jgi:hypothetical protein
MFWSLIGNLNSSELTERVEVGAILTYKNY